MLAAAPGIILLYSISLVLIYHLKLSGWVNSAAWFTASIWAGCAIALLGLMAYRYPLSRLKNTGGLASVILVSVSSIYITTVWLVMWFWDELDWRYDIDLFFLPAMTIGLVQGTVTVIEWNRLEGRRGAWRILSIATAIPAYLISFFLVLFW